MVRVSRRSLQLIGGFKLLKALVLLVSLALLYRLLQPDHTRVFVHWALKLHVDPKNKYLRSALVKLLHLDAAQLKMLGVGTILYALLFACEGVGLLLDLAWAEYLTIAETAGFIPLEAYELVAKHSPTRVAVLIGNMLIVAYLIAYVRQRTRTRAFMRQGHPLSTPGEP